MSNAESGPAIAQQLRGQYPCLLADGRYQAKAALAEGGDPAALLASLGKPADAPAAAAAAAAAIAADAPVEPDASRKAISLKPDNARSIGGTPFAVAPSFVLRGPPFCSVLAAVVVL